MLSQAYKTVEMQGDEQTMAKKESYGRYQGRKSSGVRSFLKGVIVALVIVLLFLLITSVLLQDYIVYTDDGVKLLLPWSEDAADANTALPSQSQVPLIIVDKEDPNGKDEQENSPQRPIPDLGGPIHAVQVSQTSLLAGTAEEQVLLAGGNAVVLTMKNDDGTLNYVSDVSLAVSAEASGSDPAVNQAIQELTAGELYTVARVSCFRDDLMSRRRPELAILTSGGYLWLDHGDTRWISPLRSEVTEYLAALCVELAELGFDEILLSNCGYPGHIYDQLHWILGGNAYPEDGLVEPVIADFLARMRTVLEPYGVKLSVETMGTELAGETTQTGLTLNNVLTCCDRFWLNAEEADAYANFAAAGGGQNPVDKLVRVSSAAGADEIAWAILN